MQHFLVIENRERRIARCGRAGSIARAAYRPSTEITRCIPPCYEACRVIIALRFCTAIGETITRDRVPKRIRRGCDPLKRAILACRSAFHSDAKAFPRVSTQLLSCEYDTDRRL